MRTQKGRKEMRVFWVFIPDKIGRPHQPKNERIREKTRTLLLFFRLSADVIDPTRTKEATDSCLQLVHFFPSSSLSLKNIPLSFCYIRKVFNDCVVDLGNKKFAWHKRDEKVDVQSSSLWLLHCFFFSLRLQTNRIFDLQLFHRLSREYINAAKCNYREGFM